MSASSNIDWSERPTLTRVYAVGTANINLMSDSMQFTSVVYLMMLTESSNSFNNDRLRSSSEPNASLNSSSSLSLILEGDMYLMRDLDAIPLLYVVMSCNELNSPFKSRYWSTCGLDKII